MVDQFRRPGQINVNPFGLLSLLNAKTGGQNPQLLGESLQPTIDLADWYRTTNARLNTPPRVSIAAAGFTEVIPASANEWFFINWWSIEARTVDATEYMRGDLVIQDTTAAANNWVVPTIRASQVDNGAGSIPTEVGILVRGQVGFCRNRAEGFWMPPGWRCGIVMDAVTTVGTTSLAWAMSYIPLRV